MRSAWMVRALAAIALSAAAGPAPVALAQSLVEAPPPAIADYRLSINDKLRITTFGEDSLTGEFVVGPAGRIALPLIGEIQAAGLSAADLQRAIEATLRDGYLKDPRVSVEVLSFRPFYILGEVNKPGAYPYASGMTVLNAVATANGFTYRANTKKVFIKRADEAKEHEYRLTSSTPVTPGDTVRIDERYF